MSVNGKPVPLAFEGDTVGGGYGRYAPRLYERLRELDEPARQLIMDLGELGRWPVPLAKARDQLDRSRSI